MTDKLATLIDRFDNEGFTAAKWYGLPNSDITVTGGVLEIVATGDYSSLISAVPYDMTGSSYHVEVVQTLNDGIGSTSAEIGVRVGTDNGNKIEFAVLGSSTLVMKEIVGGTSSETSVAYDPVAHRWLRVREASGTIYWDVSADSSTWVTLRSKVKNPALPSVTSVQPFLNAGFYDSETDAGTVIYDNVNQWEVPLGERGLTPGRHGMGAIDGGTLFYRNFCEEADWLWDPIPESPVLDPLSAAIVADMTATGYTTGVSMYAFGSTLITPEQILPDTPRYTLTFDKIDEYGGGVSPFEGYQMPIPLGTATPPGIPPAPDVVDLFADGHISVADPVQGKIFSLWKAVYHSASDTWSAAWGGVADYQGDGIEYHGSSTATCLTRYAAVLRAQELQAQEIPHALFIACNTGKPDVFRYPAAKTDATNAAAVAHPIEAGTRVQLDPTIDVAAISGITPGEIAIGRALQKFGAYIGDKNDTTGRSSFGFIAEFVHDGTDPGQVYVDAGFTYDFFSLSHLPWASLRVLAHWDGGSGGGS